MNLPLIKRRRAAFTVVELLVLVAIAVMLWLLIVPAGRRRPDASPVTRCVSNQRQLVLHLILLADDHQGKLLTCLSTNEGGAMEPMTDGNVAYGYQIMTNIFSSNPPFLCPTEKTRFGQKLGAPITNTNVSYFMSLDASLSDSPSQNILIGDRHLEASGKPVRPGLFNLSANNSIGWTDELHRAKQRAGALGFADGHVEFLRATVLPDTVARQRAATNRIAVP